MSDYVATIDDSGGIEPLVKWGGIYVPGDHPLACITALLLHTDALSEFNAMWTGLRGEIQEYLQCEELPAIHMRLMCGRNKPRRYRGRPNPYADCDFEKIKEWIAEGAKIITYFQGQPQVLHWSTTYELRENLSEGVLRYFSDPQLVAELNFLAKHGKRSAKRSFAQRYLKKMASPLLPLLTKKIIQIDEIMRQLKNKQVLLQVDPFADASGLDAGEILEAINKVFKLKHIAGIEVMADSDNVNLAQAADVIGFTSFRQAMVKHSFIKPDNVIFEVCDLRTRGPKCVKANYEHIANRRLQQSAGLGVSIHYAVARAAVEEVDPAFANTHMLTVTEFYEQAKIVVPQHSGYSILKEETRLALRNGEDPS